MSDRQLLTISSADVEARKAAGRALNAKQLAVAAGVAYQVARDWFRRPGFPALDGFVFWDDFTEWRRGVVGLKSTTPASPHRRAAGADRRGAPRSKHD